MQGKFKLSGTNLIVIAVVAILGAQALGYIDLSTMLQFQVQPGVGVGDCDDTVTPDIDINAYDKYNQLTAITDTMAWRKVGTKTWTDVARGTAITGLEPFAMICWSCSTENKGEMR